METSVQFKNFNGLKHIQNFVEDSVDRSLGKFESWRDFDAQVILGMVRGRSETHRPVFECELLIKGKSRDVFKPIVVKKKNPVFYLAIRDCIKVAEKLLRRTSKIRVSNRRHSNLEKNKPLHIAMAA